MLAQIGERGEQQEHRRWVLDTGATNHMTGAKSAFSELDSGIRGTVKFVDGYVVEIEGHGTILFVGKGGITAPVSVEPEEELPKSTEVNRRRHNCSGERRTRGRAPTVHNKCTGWGANSTEGGASARSNR